MNRIIEERTQRTKWFLHDRFGMFIHWGLYAIPARGEWVRSHEKISKDEYRKFFEEFNPVNYDPKKWARSAKNAGMKYAVLTAKHHDGFCLWDSRLTDYKATNTKAGRDLVKEYIEAFREEGLKVGLYFSIIDWYHDDFRASGDRQHPMRDNEAFKNKPYDFDRYLDFMHGQVRELCTDYGKIDIIWFDFSYDDMCGEKWRATELVRMVRELQPGIIMDNRLEASGEGYGTIITNSPSFYSGDFASPEQIISPRAGITDEEGNSIPWEACFTMNNHWGYCSTDKNFKSSKQLIHKLVECTSKNGNMLLNVGPTAKGDIPEESLKILAEMGEWMRQNGDSIYGCGISGFEKPEWGRYTQKGKILYAHIMEACVGPINLKGLNGKIKKARVLRDGSEMLIVKPWNVKEFPDDAFLNFGTPETDTFPLPDETDTVIEIELL